MPKKKKRKTKKARKPKKNRRTRKVKKSRKVRRSRKKNRSKRKASKRKKTFKTLPQSKDSEGNALIKVSDNWSNQAYVNEAKYKKKYKLSIKENEKFWAKEGKRITWI